jgi:hypothetical protein
VAWLVGHDGGSMVAMHQGTSAARSPPNMKKLRWLFDPATR